MVLLPGCNCCAGTCLGPGFPDFFEFDLAFEYSAGGSSEVRQTFKKTSSDGVVVNDNVSTTTATNAQAPPSASVRLNKYYEGSIGGKNKALYSFSGNNFEVSVEVTRAIPAGASVTYPGSLTTEIYIVVSCGVYQIQGVNSYRSLSGWNPAGNPIYTTSSSQCSNNGLRTIPFAVRLFCNSTATGTNPISGENVTLRQANVFPNLRTPYGSTSCLASYFFLNKRYSECDNFLTSESVIYFTDQTFFPFKQNASAYLTVTEFNSDSVNDFGDRTVSKRELLSPGSGKFATPPGMEQNYSNNTFYAKCSATAHILSARYGYGSSTGVDVVPSGLVKGSVYSPDFSGNCMSTHRDLWLADY